MSVGLKDYVKEAFNARPAGMFIPPNWVGLAAFGFLGLLNPGFWLLGAGLELGYLYVLSMNRRFQRLVRAKDLAKTAKQEAGRLESDVSQLDPMDRKLYATLESRCQAILQKQDAGVSGTDLQLQREGLGRLLWIYLKLLLTRRSIQKVLETTNNNPGGKAGTLEERSRVLTEQLKDTTLPEELRRSLASQLEILAQRLQSHKEARTKKDVVEAELTRIAEQVELLREQSMLAADPSVVSQRIDQIAATLGGTTQWIKEQQQIYGKVGDLLAEPPPIPLPPPPKPVKEGP